MALKLFILPPRCDRRGIQPIGLALRVFLVFGKTLHLRRAMVLEYTAID